MENKINCLLVSSIPHIFPSGGGSNNHCTHHYLHLSSKLPNMEMSVIGVTSLVVTLSLHT